MNSGNPTLDKNLECIYKYNPTLSKKILNLPCLTNEIKLIETDLKEPNLSYNGLILHSSTGAEIEARTIFEKAPNKDLCTHFILGIGLGYLFKEFCEHAKGKIILYEDNLEILRVTLELVDFSAELSRANVKIVSDFLELKQIYSESYEYKMEVNFAILDSYRTLYGENAQKILNKIDFINRSSMLNLKHLKEKSLEHLLAIFDNLPYTANETPLYEINNLYEGKTALIVSAGPTLDKNIETIKKNCDKFVIFCVGTAFKTLAKNDITPDFINVIENIDCSGQVSGFDLSNINLILEPSTNTSFHSLQTKRTFIYPSNVAPWSKYWCELNQIDASPYATCSTVALSAINSAKILGFKKIILVGQDLAFLDNSCYSKDSAYSDLIFEINSTTGKPEYKINNYDNYIKSLTPTGGEIAADWCKDFAENKLKILNDSLCFVKGIEGEPLPTERAYAIFLEQFIDFARDNRHLDLINTSLKGAQIDGFKNIPLTEALESATSFDKMAITQSWQCDKQSILTKLKNDKIALENALNLTKKAEFILQRLDKKVRINRPITQEAAALIKDMFKIYKNIYNEYYTKNSLYNLVSLNDTIEFEHAIKTMSPITNSNNKYLIDCFFALKKYYTNVNKNGLLILNKITNIEF